MVTLYQKYRPSNFTEVVNQNHVKITLQNELETENTAQAYLFSGPRGTGKTTVARVFAKALNCEQRKSGESEPCNACNSCQQINAGASMDIIEIDAASHTGVDNVRENIIANARLSVSGHRYKVFVIDEVHMLSTSAFNALLKILEEPPVKVVFILATTEAHQLPATIISRCQRFDFKRIRHGDIIQKLEYIAGQESVSVAREVLESIARSSDGHMRDAESLLGQVFSVGGKNINREHADLIIPRSNIMAVANFICLVAKKDTAGAIRLINELVDEGVDLRQFAADITENARRIMLAKVHISLSESYAADFGQAAEEKLMPIVESLSVERLAELVRVFIAAETELKTASIAQLPLELAVIKFTRLAAAEAAPAILPSSHTSFTPSPSPLPAAMVPLSIVEEKWNEVLTKIKKHNHSLSFILRACELRDDNGSLCLAFKYKFHQDRVTQPSIKDILQAVFKEVYGSPIAFVTILDENLSIATSDAPEVAPPEIAAAPQPTETTAPEQKAESPDVDAILKMFGGKVMN